MRKRLLRGAEVYVKQNKHHRTRNKVVRFLACIVVFCTTYALILPAITMQASCPLEEHTHSESCYQKITTQTVTTLSCSYEALNVHLHSEECRDAEGLLTCGLADFVVHTHSDDCYDGSGALLCQLPEVKTHEHTDSCYKAVEAEPEEETKPAEEEAEPVEEETEQITEVHEHDDSCYTVTRGELICQIPEVTEEDSHLHTDSCYCQGKLVCQLAETEGHSHSTSCYAQGDMVCELPESEEHSHGDSCYAQGPLICALPEEEAHSHTAECYTSVLGCGLDERPAHQHTDACYEQVKTLSCQLEVAPKEAPAEEPEVTKSGEEPEATEPADEAPAELKLICKKDVILLHSHTQECFEEYLDENNAIQARLVCTKTVVTEHRHSEDCYTVAEVPLENTEELTCTIPENHIHGEGCFDEAGALSCTIPEGHVHTDMCHGTWQLICGKEEHTHNLYCMADPQADLETEEIWSATFADISMTGDWAADTLAIAQTQLGYRESTCNYQVMEDGLTTKGYTRYGAWHEDPYGDWNTLFAMFCLHYGGVQDLPVHTDAVQWQAALADESCGLYRTVENWQPQPGQLVFLSGDPVRVGIVEAAEAQTFTAIEGDVSGQVQRTSHTTEEVAGYADLAEARVTAEANHVHTDTCYESQLICTLLSHEHDDTCYKKVLACSLGKQEETYLCGLEAHIHDASCFDEAGDRICGMEDHTHFEPCTDPYAHIYCWLAEHRHSESCLNEAGHAVCGSDEHIHDSRCCNYTDALMVMIDTLPTSEAAEAMLLAYEEAADQEGYAAYQKKVTDLAWSLYNAYQELSEEEKALVTNYDRLMDLSWLWSTATYESTGSRYYPMTNGKWITESTEDYVHVNKVVPDRYTIDGLILGEKKTDGFDVSFTPLFDRQLTDEEAVALTGFKWTNLESAGFKNSYGANLILPADATAKKEFRENKKNFIVYYNVGTYNGKQVDLLIQIVNYEVFNDDVNGPADGVLGFNANGNIGVSVCGVSWVQLQYNFISHANIEKAIEEAKDTGSLTTRMTVRGSTSFFDVDYSQAVQMAGSTNTPWTEMLTGIYVTDVIDAVPDLAAVDALATVSQKRDYFRNWTPSDCVLKIGSVATTAGPVVYSPHVYDAADESWVNDTKHSFTMTYDHTWFYMFYSFDKGRNAEGGIRHYGDPVSKGSLTVKNEVTGVIPDAESTFDYQITFYKSDANGTSSVDTSLNGTYGNVKLEKGVGTFSLKNGESVTLSNIPIREYGTSYQVVQLDHDGYVVKTSMTSQRIGEELKTDGQYTQDSYRSPIQEDSKMAQQQIVVFENYGGPILPNTGGAGTNLYTLGGIALILVSAAYLVYSKKRRRGDV